MKARHKRWLAAIKQHCCIVTGANHYNCQAHHVVGRTAKHNKIAIGHVWVLPLVRYLHDVGSNYPLNVTHYPKEFENVNGTQKELFMRLYHSIVPRAEDFGLMPGDLPTQEEINAIMEYRK